MQWDDVANRDQQYAIVEKIENKVSKNGRPGVVSSFNIIADEDRISFLHDRAGEFRLIVDENNERFFRVSTEKMEKFRKLVKSPFVCLSDSKSNDPTTKATTKVLQKNTKSGKG